VTLQLTAEGKRRLRRKKLLKEGAKVSYAEMFHLQQRGWIHTLGGERVDVYDAEKAEREAKVEARRRLLRMRRSLQWKAGTWVKHKKYGIGRVVESDGASYRIVAFLSPRGAKGITIKVANRLLKAATTGEVSAARKASAERPKARRSRSASRHKGESNVRRAPQEEASNLVRWGPHPRVQTTQFLFGPRPIGGGGGQSATGGRPAGLAISPSGDALEVPTDRRRSGVRGGRVLIWCLRVLAVGALLWWALW
jgi:hypothetical protein